MLSTLLKTILFVDSGSKMQRYAQSRNIQLEISMPYYVQEIGQVEDANKILINFIMRAYRNSPRGARCTTPFNLVYGQDVMLPVEINLQSLRIQRQNDMLKEDFWNLMFYKINDLDEKKLMALHNICRQKERVSRFFNKRVAKKKYFKW